MNTDKRSWMAKIAVVTTFFLCGSTFAAEEVKFISDDVLWDEVSKLNLTKPDTLQAEEFHWEFEYTKAVMLGDVKNCHSFCEPRRPQSEVRNSNGPVLDNIEWSFKMTRRYMRYALQPEKQWTFGGYAFNR